MRRSTLIALCLVIALAGPTIWIFSQTGSPDQTPADIAASTANSTASPLSTTSGSPSSQAAAEGDQPAPDDPRANGFDRGPKPNRPALPPRRNHPEFEAVRQTGRLSLWWGTQSIVRFWSKPSDPHHHPILFVTRTTDGQEMLCAPPAGVTVRDVADTAEGGGPTGDSGTKLPPKFKIDLIRTDPNDHRVLRVPCVPAALATRP